MRALWLHFPDDPRSVECQDQYMWGKSLLVAPVLEKAATARRVYLPPGIWYDFWTGDRIEGGRDINRSVDLETLPLYIRAGSILPLGPVKQFVDENVDGHLAISIYPGANASFQLYEDDGRSFNYRKGDWMGIAMTWNDAHRKLDMGLAPGSRMLAPTPRTIEIEREGVRKVLHFEGRPVSVSFGASSVLHRT
jgi:alpha-glucosidase/alpha-D-xyloside xylohydrolase